MNLVLYFPLRKALWMPSIEVQAKRLEDYPTTYPDSIVVMNTEVLPEEIVKRLQAGNEVPVTQPILHTLRGVVI